MWGIILRLDMNIFLFEPDYINTNTDSPTSHNQLQLYNYISYGLVRYTCCCIQRYLFVFYTVEKELISTVVDSSLTHSPAIKHTPNTVTY